MNDVKGIDKWIFAILIILTALVVLVCGILPVVRVSSAELSKEIKTVIENIGTGNAKSGDFITLSWIGVVKGLFKNDLPSDGVKVLRSIAVALSVPYVLVAIAAVLCLFRRLRTFIAAACVSLAGFAAAVLALLVFVPSSLKAREAGVRTSPGVAWWILAAGCLVIFALSLFAVIKANQAQKQTVVKTEAHGIRCGFGELRGMEIPLYTGKDIVIGSDKTRCNYVSFEEGIEAVHCRIRYTGNNCYEVTNQSREGIMIDGKRVVSGNGMQVSSGTTLILASKYVVDLL